MMKRIMMLAIVSLCFFTTSAQTEKGRFALSGRTDMSLLSGKATLMMDSTAGQKSSSTAFNANLGFAYFVANNLAIGVSGSFQYSKVKTENVFGYSQNYTAGVIPTITYFLPLKGNLKPNISAGAGYLWLSTSELDAEGLSLNVAPGVSWFVNRNISLDLGVQYSHNDLKDNKYGNSDFTYKQQTIGVLAGLSIYF